MSAWLTTANQQRTAKITSIRNETSSVKSFTFNDKTASKASPGQFAMIWIPGVDEVPMSFSYIDTKQEFVSVTVKKVGEATKALHRMKVGDIIGVRGPFGKGYTLKKTKNALIAGGGTGMASLLPLAEKMIKDKKTRITILHGAKTRGELLFLEELENIHNKGNHRFIATTDDGSYGIKRLVTGRIEHMLSEERFDIVYASGPEAMLYKMYGLSRQSKIPCQISLERLMRCAVGICGSCVIGKYRICIDGPVFSGEQLDKVREEFGQFKRGLDGRKLPL